MDAMPLPQAAPPVVTADPLVSVRDLAVRFVTPDATVHAVNGVSFDLASRESLCILGESGSGKSVTLRALMGLNCASAAWTWSARRSGNSPTSVAAASRWCSRSR